jgi:coenzyme F420-reducing hydrogenase beta subunit
MRNVDILSKEYCTGCGLCANCCPHNAIEMISNEDGFLMPHINNNCVNCGLCASKCPILSQKSGKKPVADICYAVQCRDEDRFECSSGGAFKAFANYALKNGGAVCGATFNKDFTRLSHKLVKKSKELDGLFKSKYLQSEMGDVYKEIKDFLNTGKFLVFSGCPCQVAALQQYVNYEYTNLITIDILCHGVPSPVAYRYFLNEKNPKKKLIKKVDFRDKKYGWGKNLTIEFSDGTETREPYNGTYFSAFLSGLNMRECCYNCQWASKNRVGDITIGDFWGCADYRKELNDNKGTSLVLCNTKIGAEFVQKCKNDFKLFEQMAFSDVYKVSEKINWAFHTPTPKNRFRKCFFKHLKEDGFYNATRYAQRQILDVGIVGWWIQNNRSNYGSTLTDYALGRYIESLGLSVAYISPPNFNRDYAGEFNKRYGYRMTAQYDYGSMIENNKYIDTFVVASDVLWFYDAMIQTGYTFMLDFVDDNKKKIAYAASFGKIDKFIPEEEHPKVKYLLSRFDGISMREQQGVDVLKDKFDLSSTRVLDPVFLCDLECWNEIARNSNMEIKENFVFAYLMDPTPEKAMELQTFADRHNWKLVTIPDRQNNYQDKAKILAKYGLLANASLEDFIYCFKHAKFVITDSFHGMCFSIIFRKSFYALVNRARGASRFEDLAENFRLKHRLLENMSELNVKPYKNDNLDYFEVEKYILSEISKSKEWLVGQLSSEKKPIKIKESTLIDYKLYVLQQQLKNK